VIDPFAKAEAEMVAADHSIDKIPKWRHEEHLWADALLLFWTKNKRLPDADELQQEMSEEWDDPVPWNECWMIIGLLKE
jgi:hypothetical protein